MRILKKIFYFLQRKHICSDCNAQGTEHFSMPNWGGGEKDEQFYFCWNHARKSGFCLGCGYFCGGIESFDFSEIPGYCDQCVDELNADMGLYDYLDEEYDYDAGMS